MVWYGICLGSCALENTSIFKIFFELDSLRIFK
jgi:hypothetical protein